VWYLEVAHFEGFTISYISRMDGFDQSFPHEFGNGSATEIPSLPAPLQNPGAIDAYRELGVDNEPKKKKTKPRPGWGN
jgi:hypothetical protein